MGITSMDWINDCHNAEDPLPGLKTISDSTKQLIFGISETYNLNSVRSLKPRRRLILNFKQSEKNASLMQELFLKKSQEFGRWIPKQVVSVEEKYLRWCMEHVHMSAQISVPCGLPLNLDSLDVGIMAESSTFPETKTTKSFDVSKFFIECPLGADDGKVASPVGQWIVGSVTRSNSMLNILKSPLFQRLGVVYGDAESSLRTRSLFDGGKFYHTNHRTLPSVSPTSSSHDCEKEKLGHKSHEYKSGFIQGAERSLVSMSKGPHPAINDDCSPSSLFTPDSQGILKYSWSRGLLHFEFSVDDQKALYVANAFKVNLPSEKALDYIYSFYAKPYGLKEYEYLSSDSGNVVGKMKVSSSLALSPEGSKIAETEFVLFAVNDNYGFEVQNSHHKYRKTRKLSKVMDVFKPGPTFKYRSPSQVSIMSSVHDHCPLEITDDTGTTADPTSISNVSESQFPPNLEMAAIVVRRHALPTEDTKREEVGGWGLKFLKKREIPAASREPLHSECSERNVGDCSTSTDIVIPVGIHGGPRTRQGGPSSIIERWRSGGNCDCGGWDIGCPLTILKVSPRKNEGLSHPEVQSQCKSFNIFPEGSTQGAPAVKMVNIRDGSYFLNFKPTLSVLQCFSIAVAIVHARSHVQD